MGIELLKTLASLLGILGLIFLLAYVFKRFGLGGVRSAKDTPGFRVLNVKLLAPGKHLYAIEIGSKIVVVGATDKTLAPLTEISDPKELELLRDAFKPGTSSFSSFLKKAEQ